MSFEWDPGKAAANVKKHGISFGVSSLGHLLAVSHAYRSGGIRLISARRVTRTERKLYEEA